MRDLALISLLTLGLGAQDAPPPPVAAAASALTLAQRAQALPRLSSDAVRQLQGELALAADPGKAYAEALAAYTLVSHLRAQDPKGAEALLDRTLASLKPRKDAESLALQAACLGLKMGFSPSSGMVLGPRATGLLEEARRLAPASPRVLTFQGVNLLHTPAFFGGGAKAALPVLQAAVKAAQAEVAPTDPWAPTWGRAESLAWLALAEVEAGDPEAARAHVAQALAVDPNYGFVHAVVAPRLKAPK
jgi:tetratricopeptide (TPR) repeat protein